MAINLLNNISSTGSLTITKPTTDPLLTIHNTTNGGGAAIRFLDTTDGSQPGDLTYRHSDSQSQGGGASWHFVSEPDTVLVVGSSSVNGRFVVKSAGSVGEVDYGFFDDVNTGMVRTSADNVSLVAGGVAGIGVSSTAVSLKYAGTTKLTTLSTGVQIAGDGAFSGDLTVSGGDITLGGTGRIQGVDTVSAGTDAANKTYVDNAISGVPQGTITGGGQNLRLALWDGSTSIGSDGDFTYNGDTIFATKLSVQNQINTNSANLEINYANGDGSTTNFKNFDIRDGKNAIIASFNGASKLTTLQGDLSVNGEDFRLGAVMLQDGGGAGRLGFNRDTSTGAIHDSNYNAFQIQVDTSGSSGKLEIQEYTGAGTFVGNTYITGSGITINDYVIHNGDTNTYFGFGSADAFRVVAGGSEKLHINTSGLQLGGTNARVSTIYDQDNMSSNSATALATQQSIKQYVDTTFSNAGTVTGTGSSGRVAFWNGTSSIASNSTLSWDDGNTRLGIGTSSATTSLTVQGGHSTSRMNLYYFDASNVRKAYIDMWASEPGVSYNGSGIGSNINGSPYYGRKVTEQGQTYIRFIDGQFEVYTGTNSSGTGSTAARRFYIENNGLSTFSTTPEVGTRSVGDNTGRAASTAFVTTAIGNVNTGVQSVSDDGGSTINVSGSSTARVVAAVTGAVSLSSANLATGAQIQTAINNATTGALKFISEWSASGTAGGSPDLRATSTHVPGNYYIVSVAGSATPNGAGTTPNEWAVGDWCIRADLATDTWQKIDNTQVGNVTGSGSSGRVAYWNSNTNITNDGDLLFDGANLTVGGSVNIADDITLTNAGGVIQYIGGGYIGAQDNFYVGGATNGTDHTYIGDNGRNVTIYNGATLTISGALNLQTLSNATTDTDKFLVADGGEVKYRTGAQVLSDIGAQASGNYLPVANPTFTGTLTGPTVRITSGLSVDGAMLAGNTFSDPDLVLTVLDTDTTQSIRDKINDTTSITKVSDSTAPAPGVFAVNGANYPEGFGPFYTIDEGDTFTFEFWVKKESGTATSALLYAGSNFYNASGTYLGNSQRYWGESGLQVAGMTDWYHVSGTLGPVRGSNTSEIPTTAVSMRLLFLFNYAANASIVTHYCGLKVYKSGKTVTQLYRKTLGSEANTTRNRDLVVDQNGDLFGSNLTITGNLIGNTSNTTELGTYSTGSIKRIRMTQGGELHFGDTTTSAPLGITEGDWDSFGDNDRLSIYGRASIKFYAGATSAVLAATLGSTGLTLNTITNATSDTDKFLVSDSGVIKYRTGAQVLSDIGAASSGSLGNYLPLAGGTMSGTIVSTATTALQMDGAADAQGVLMQADSSGTYPVFLRSLNPSSGGETSPWLYKEASTPWGIWHNNPLNSFDWTRSGNNLGIANNVGGQINSVMIRLNSADGSGTFAGKVVTTEVESSGTLLLDAAADITIDAGGQDIILSDDGTIFGTLSNSSGFQIRSRVNNADMLFRGVDNGAEFNALTLDMSEGGNATFAGTVTAADLLTVNGDGHLFLGADGETPKIDMMYDDHASGAGWDTRIFTGKTDDLPNGQSFPTSTIAGGYGTQYQANSDGAFFGIIPYTAGHFRPVINWGDDVADSPFSFQFNGVDKATVSSTGVITSLGGSSTEWNTAYDNSIISFTDSGTSTVTLTLTQQDGGTLSTSFSVPQGTVTGGPYLPLAGGTLTGGLIGTSAGFTEGVYDNIDGLRLLNPGGGSSTGQIPSQSGAIKVTLPVSWTNTMMRMTIKVYEYTTNESFTIVCGGYNYSPGTTWVNHFAYIESSAKNDRNFTVRFGHDGSKCCIFIGELNSTWSYPQVFVTEFEAGYSGTSASTWRTGWDVGFETSAFGTITQTETNTQVNNWARDGVNLSYTSGSGNVLVTTQPAGNNTTRAASTAFVTAAVATGVGNYLPLAGGTLTGGLTGTSATFSGLVFTKIYKTISANISNAYVRIAEIDETGGMLSSTVRVTMTAHGNSHVTTCNAIISVGHSQDILIESNNLAYTQVTLKVDSNSNGLWTLSVKSDSANATTYQFDIQGLSNNLTITPNPTASQTGTTLEHTTNFGTNVTATGGSMYNKFGGKLFISSVDANTTSVTALVLDGDEVEKRTLGTGAFGPTPVGAYLPLAGGTMTGTNGVVFPDAFKLNLGTGSDLQIYHDGTHSLIKNTTGNLYILDDGYIEIGNGTELSAGFVINGAANLYYDNVLQLETTSTGISTNTIDATVSAGSAGNFVVMDGTRLASRTAAQVLSDIGAGTGTVTGTGSSGRIAFWDGTSSISSDSGFTFASADDSITCGAVKVGVGSVSAPSLTFNSDTNTGIYSPNSDMVYVAGGGANLFSITSNGISVNNMVAMGSPASVFLTRNGNRIESRTAAQVLSDIGGTSSSGVTSVATTAPILGGTITSTGTISLRSPVNGNWHNGGAPVVGSDGLMEIGRYIDFHTSNTGTSDFDVRLNATSGLLTVTGSVSSSSNITSTGYMQSSYIRCTSSGTRFAPTFSFTSDTNTGMFLNGTDEVALSAGAAIRVLCTSTYVKLDGDVGIGRVPSTKLDIDGTVLVKDGTGIGDLYLGNLGTNNHFRFHTNNSNTYFDMNCGNMYWRQGSSIRYTFFPSTANMTINGTLTQNSDVRRKENIVEIKDCISKVKAMRGVYYNRTDINTEVTKVGVIAQEVEAVLPEVILESPEDGLKSVAYSELTSVLINAIKEQQEIIEDLKTRITKLEN